MTLADWLTRGAPPYRLDWRPIFLNDDTDARAAAEYEREDREHRQARRWVVVAEAVDRW